MASPSLMDTLFQRSLDDIIKGVRQQQSSTESIFISKVIEEIRREIKSTDLQTKSTALQKLTYLNSIHFIDMSWASFHAIECISSPTFSHKKIGYLAISQSFNESTPVILLISNQLRKDLKSSNEFEVSLALDCLSRIGTVDLCRDLTSEVFTLMSSSKVFVRKKGIGVVLRLFEKYPDAVRVCFKKLVESLEGSDSQIVSAVVGVFCELASKDPRSYLPLAPEFYRILVDSKNNWVLIKVLKIFAKLAPLEPRLAKRMVEPICDHMRKTGAKSLVFECIKTVVTSFTEYESAMKLAAAKIREFLMEDDPNLKYLGLHAVSIMAPKHLWAVLENKDVVIQSLSDEDPNIKLESLRLVMAMASESNLVETCRVLVNYALKSDPEFCNEILGSILSTCCRNVYDVIIDFDWYVSLLGEMSRIPNCSKGEEIENQLIDIGMRVKDVRPELVRVGRDLLIDPALLGNPFLHRLLSAAAWVCGEYVEFSRNPVELMEALLQPRTSLLPSSIRTVYMQSAFKVLIFCIHSYFLQKEEMTSEVSDLASKRECSESSDLATGKALVQSDQDEGFNPRESNQSYEDPCVVDTGVGQTSTPAFMEEKSFMHESIVNLLNLMELALGPLSGSLDVEIQERAWNVLGFIELVRQEFSNPLIRKEANLEREKVIASRVVEWVHDAFSEELGPVSVTAQDRVLIPDELVLKENLTDLDAICGGVELPSPGSFSLTSPYYGESAGFSVSNLQGEEDSEPSTESTSLLTEHRKRHGLYYLPSEKNKILANDYPPANDPSSGINTNDDTEDLVKLADQSLVSKRKPNHAKPRPMVVKLEGGDAAPVVSKKPELKDDLLSGAIRDVLLGNEAKAASSQSKRKGKFFPGNGMELFSEPGPAKAFGHVRKLSSESVGSDGSSLRGSELSNAGIPNSSGDGSLDLPGIAEVLSSAEVVGNAELQFSGDAHIVLPMDQRHKMNRVLLTMQRRLVTAKTDMEDLISRLNQEIAVKDYLTTKVKDLEVELETNKQKNKENMQQAILIERERLTQMQWDMEELRRKSLEMELKLKSKEGEQSSTEFQMASTDHEKDMVLEELDATRKLLEDLSKRYEELEAKSKADIKFLAKEFKSLKNSQTTLKQELSQSLKEKSEVEKLLHEEREMKEHGKIARKKLLHDCRILCDQLQECNVNLLSEDDNFVVDFSLADALDLLTTSDDQIGHLLTEAQQLFEDDKITAPDDNLRSTDDELRNMLANLFTDNAMLRKQVNSTMRRALKMGSISRSSNDRAPSSNNHVER